MSDQNGFPDGSSLNTSPPSEEILEDGSRVPIVRLGADAINEILGNAADMADPFYDVPGKLAYFLSIDVDWRDAYDPACGKITYTPDHFAQAVCRVIESYKYLDDYRTLNIGGADGRRAACFERAMRVANLGGPGYVAAVGAKLS